MTRKEYFDKFNKIKNMQSRATFGGGIFIDGKLISYRIFNSYEIEKNGGFCPTTEENKFLDKFFLNKEKELFKQFCEGKNLPKIGDTCVYKNSDAFIIKHIVNIYHKGEILLCSQTEKDKTQPHYIVPYIIGV